MSGEPVALLVSQPSGTLVSLVRALAELETAGLPRHALVGGVAVMVRLSQAHRATQDLDEVVEPSSPTAAGLIAGPGAVENRAETAGGVHVDLISVGDQDLRSLQASDLKEPRRRAPVRARARLRPSQRRTCADPRDRTRRRHAR